MEITGKIFMELCPGGSISNVRLPLPRCVSQAMLCCILLPGPWRCSPALRVVSPLTNCRSVAVCYVITAGGSGAQILDEFGALSYLNVRSYTFQIVAGLDYLHRHCVVHRDVKCANALLNRSLPSRAPPSPSHAPPTSLVLPRCLPAALYKVAAANPRAPALPHLRLGPSSFLSD